MYITELETPAVLLDLDIAEKNLQTYQPVSYTHLDVYKRQTTYKSLTIRSFPSAQMAVCLSAAIMMSFKSMTGLILPMKSIAEKSLTTSHGSTASAEISLPWQMTENSWISLLWPSMTAKSSQQNQRKFRCHWHKKKSPSCLIGRGFFSFHFLMPNKTNSNKFVSVSCLHCRLQGLLFFLMDIPNGFLFGWRLFSTCSSHGFSTGLACCGFFRVLFLSNLSGANQALWAKTDEILTMGQFQSFINQIIILWQTILLSLIHISGQWRPADHIRGLYDRLWQQTESHCPDPFPPSKYRHIPPKPVSYTHLDVYKRQVLTFAALFYQKRFILEKESRIANLMDNKKLFFDDVIDIDFTEKWCCFWQIGILAKII